MYYRSLPGLLADNPEITADVIRACAAAGFDYRGRRTWKLGQTSVAVFDNGLLVHCTARPTISAWPLAYASGGDTFGLRTSPELHFIIESDRIIGGAVYEDSATDAPYVLATSTAFPERVTTSGSIAHVTLRYRVADGYRMDTDRDVLDAIKIAEQAGEAVGTYAHASDFSCEFFKQPRAAFAGEIIGEAYALAVAWGARKGAGHE